MGIFEKFHKPEENKEEILIQDMQNANKQKSSKEISKKIAAVSAGATMLAGGVGDALAKEPSLDNLEPKKLSPEYQERQPSKTITERAAEKGIKIDPTSIEDSSNKDNIPPDGYIFDSATNSFILDVGNKNSKAVRESIADQDIVDEKIAKTEKTGIFPGSDEDEDRKEDQSEPTMNAPQDNSPDTKLPTNNATESNLKSQSSLEQVTELPIEELPSDPEEIKALIEKTIQTLAELLKKAPSMLTEQLKTQIIDIAMTALNQRNTKSTNQLNDIIKFNNPK